MALVPVEDLTGYGTARGISVQESRLDEHENLYFGRFGLRKKNLPPPRLISSDGNGSIQGRLLLLLLCRILTVMGYTDLLMWKTTPPGTSVDAISPCNRRRLLEGFLFCAFVFTGRGTLRPSSRLQYGMFCSLGNFYFHVEFCNDAFRQYISV